MITPKDAHILLSRTCDYVTLCGKKGFADVVELRFVRWGDFPGLSEWTQCNSKGAYNMEAGKSKSRCDVTIEAEVGVILSSSSWERQGNGFSPRTPRRKQLCQHLIVTLMKLNSHLQNDTIINVHCLSL